MPFCVGAASPLLLSLSGRALPSQHRIAIVPRVLEFRILGPLEVVSEQGPVTLGGPRQRATLAILLLAANRVVSIDRLADDLYRGAAPVTAVTQVQRQISELRKALGASSAIETRAPGYVLRLAPDQLDLDRFQRLAEQGMRAAGADDARRASDCLQEALGLWRGVPLADLVDEPFARGAIARLDELRLVALEHRIEADLILGRHAEVVGELEKVVADYPLREGFVAQLMLALYRAGRQTEALAAYRTTRDALVDQFGIDPSPALQDRQKAILSQDPSLNGTLSRRAPAKAGSVIVVVSSESPVDALLSVAEPLGGDDRELILVRLLQDQDQLGQVAFELNARRATPSTTIRTAAFITSDVAGDVIRLAETHDGQIVLLEAPDDMADPELPETMTRIFEGSPADVAFLTARVTWGPSARLFVPFGGAEHDWAALEVAASLGAAQAAEIVLVGTGQDAVAGRRDASRLLADAALAVQRVAKVDCQPLIVQRTGEALLAAVASATLVVVGMSTRWRHEGLGEQRRTLLRRGRQPTLLVHSGLRPGLLSPQQSRTRFSWDCRSAANAPA